MSEKTVTPNGVFYVEWLRKIHEKRMNLRWWNWMQRRTYINSENKIIHDMSQREFWVAPVTNDKFFEYPEVPDGCAVSPSGKVRKWGEML